MAEAVIEAPEHITVVTGETFGAYVDKQLGIVEPTPEEKAATELEKVEAEKAERVAAEEDVTHDVPEVPKDKKGKINERFKELTDKRKAAEALAAQKAEEAAALKAEREALARERDELKAKYEPPKTSELGPKPELSTFATAADYEKAMEEWTGDKVRIETAAKQQAETQKREAEAIQKAWNKRLAEAKAELPDYDEVVGASQVQVSDQVRDAIIESEVGPKILHHLAKTPDVAEKIGQMTVGRALKEIGRLEATLGDKPQGKSVSVAEISKAPPPITPLKGANAPVGNLKGSDDVPKGMSYDEWKKLYEAGKIH